MEMVAYVQIHRFYRRWKGSHDLTLLHLTGDDKKNKRPGKGELNMKRKKTSIRTFCMTIMLLILLPAGLYAKEQKMPFPKYGTGPIQVRIYTDYFCPPCRAMEPMVEPILHDLLKRNAITLTLIDVPYHRLTPLYAKYFLYALKTKNDPDHAFHIRNALIAATADKNMTTEKHIEELLKSKGIPYTVFEARPALDRYNALIKEDNINATPTCAIVKKGKKESFTGGPDIIAALKRLL
jgi:protein-disulfide isomerase